MAGAGVSVKIYVSSGEATVFGDEAAGRGS